jgi:hypothetical protein
MRVFVVSSLATLSVAVLCCGGSGGGGVTPPSLPTAAPDVVTDAGNPFIFNDTGVIVGTSGFASLTIQNIGSQNMVVSSVTYTPDHAGDTAITLSPGVSPAIPATVPFDQYLVIGLTCTPPDAETFNGTVEVKSNAVNLPDIIFNMQCTGVTP